MQDNHISLSEAAQRSPGRPSSNAVWRWCRRGIKSRTGQRVKLNHIRVGGKIYTTPESLAQFFSEVAQADAEYFSRPNTKQESKPTDTHREKDIDRAEKELQAAGI